MKRALRILAVLTGLVLALVGTMAVAAWLSTGSASATATATSVDQANAPTTTRGVGSVGLSWAASTLASGAPVGGYRVLRHHGSDTPVEVCLTASTSCTDSSPLATGVTYGVIATVGTYWQGPESELTTFTYDDQAPTTTADVTPAPNADGWSKGPSSDVTVSLTATDTGSNPSSGVDHVGHSVDGSAAVLHDGATASFTVSGAGTHTVTYFAVDRAGNTEATKSLTVKIDPDAPVTTLTSPNPVPTWSKVPVTLEFSSTDSGTSGLASITAGGTTTALSGEPSTATTSRTISAEGATQVDYFATDVAGNVEGTKSVTVKIDHTAPTSTIDPATSTSWIKQSSQSVTITGADTSGATGGNSGVASIVYQVDGQQAVTTTSPATFTVGQGDHTITYHAVDVAGNVETTRSATIRVDNGAPTASLVQVGNGQPTISGTDTTSGVASVSWRDGGSGAYTTVSGSSTTLNLTNGSHTIWYFATDNAGNAGTAASQTVTVGTSDTTPPTVVIIDITNGDAFPTGNSGTGSWAKVCGTGRVCATIADDATPSANITASYTLVRTDTTQCWDGSSFVSGSSCSVSMTYNATASRFEGAAIPRGTMGANHSFSLTVRGTDQAGLTGTQVRTFTTIN